MTAGPKSFTLRQLLDGIELPTGDRHTLRIVPLMVRVRLHIDPNEASSLDDKFTLTGYRDDATVVEEHIKTVKDDLVPGDAFVDLMYMPLRPDLNYTLEIDPGEGQDRYILFDHVCGDELGIPLPSGTIG